MLTPSSAVMVNIRVTRQPTVESLESQFTVTVELGQLSVATTKALITSQVGIRLGLQPNGPPFGHVNVGASQSFTVMVNEHGELTTAESLAVQVTVVVPTG